MAHELKVWGTHRECGQDRVGAGEKRRAGSQVGGISKASLGQVALLSYRGPKPTYDFF